jgi:hypothetical protein
VIHYFLTFQVFLPDVTADVHGWGDSTKRSGEAEGDADAASCPETLDGGQWGAVKS